MAETVGVEVGDGLEDALRPVGLAGVDGLLQEVLVGQGVGRGMVLGREPGLGPGEVEPDDGQLELRLGLHGRPDELLRGQGEDALALGMGVNLEEGVEVLGEAEVEHPHGAGDNAVFEGRLGPAPHLRPAVELLLGPGQAAVEGGHSLDAGQPGVLVELRGEADLDVAHPFGLVVLGELVARPLQGRGGLEDGRGIGESLQIVGQAGILALEDQAPQSGLVMGRKRDALGVGQLDQGREAERSVQVEVEVGLGDPLDELPGDDHGASLSPMIRAISGLWRAISSGVSPFSSWGKTSQLSVAWMK